MISAVRFQVLKETSIKMAVFWVVAPCSLVLPPSSAPWRWSSNHLWIVGKLLRDYTTHQPRRQPSSYLYLLHAAPAIFSCVAANGFMNNVTNNLSNSLTLVGDFLFVCDTEWTCKYMPSSGLKMETVCLNETMVSPYESTTRKTSSPSPPWEPEISHLLLPFQNKGAAVAQSV
jgi:hypothetical protein